MPDFHEHPGLYFVVATLLPLASFVLIFLACGAWALLRPYRESGGTGEALYNLFGGDRGGPWASYLATGAIALAFLFSLTGAVQLFTDEHRHEKEFEEKRAGLPLQDRDEALEKLEVQEVQARQELKGKWSGRFDWLQVRPAGVPDSGRGTLLQVGYAIDNLSALMFVMVTFIASFIHLFSIGYMADELAPVVEDHQVHTEDGHLHRRGRFGRFFMFLSLFCFSMLNLVLADNLFQVFVSWELVGICSYLLVGFYFERQSASNAANKAFITNRVGDAGFILGLLIIWTYVGTFNFEDLFRQIRSPRHDARGHELVLGAEIVRAQGPAPDPETGRATLTVAPSASDAGDQVVLFPARPALDGDAPGQFRGVEPGEKVDVKASPRANEYGAMPYWMLVAAGLGIFLGCVGKSAQFPLQVWLPDAMEGPTPVSALIHAATMVAAGVYLVGRCYPLFTPEALVVIAYVGAITLFVAATIAVVMTDIKKVLAYSTVSQLGYMMLALGVGGWVVGLFHLVTHAFFKALLFLGSGSVIYGCHHEQDMLKMGGLAGKMKITATTMFLGVLAISGAPFFSGWYSKDGILANAFGYAAVHRHHVLLFLLPLVTAGLTTFYMFRMWFMTFWGPPRDRHVYEHAHESPWKMTVPLVVLAFFSVVVAWPALDLSPGPGGTKALADYWPVWNPQASWLGHQLHHAQPESVLADFGYVEEEGESWHKIRDEARNERLAAHQNHGLAGDLALGLVILGLVFAALLYYYRVLDPAETKEQFASLHTFLSRKWYFDELYSVALVRPALAVAHWFKAFDLGVIDGILHGTARATVWTSRLDGRFDNGIVDGLVNLVANTCYRVGASLRAVQTGFLRNYVLFLVLAAVGIFVVLSYFVSLASAGP